MINWLGQANGGLRAQCRATPMPVPTGTIAGTGDFNGDGRDDMLWRNNDGNLTNWLGQPNGSFASNIDNAYYQVSTELDTSSAPATSTATGATTSCGGTAIGRDDQLAGPFERRLRLNMPTPAPGPIGTSSAPATSTATGATTSCGATTTATVTNWLGQANGSFASNFGNAFYQVNDQLDVAGTGDFNGDGRDDILWRHSSGQVTNWLGQANGGFASNISTTPTPTWHVVEHRRLTTATGATTSCGATTTAPSPTGSARPTAASPATSAMRTTKSATAGTCNLTRQARVFGTTELQLARCPRRQPENVTGASTILFMTAFPNLIYRDRVGAFEGVGVRGKKRGDQVQFAR